MIFEWKMEIFWKFYWIYWWHPRGPGTQISETNKQIWTLLFVFKKKRRKKCLIYETELYSNLCYFYTNPLWNVPTNISFSVTEHGPMNKTQSKNLSTMFYFWPSLANMHSQTDVNLIKRIPESFNFSPSDHRTTLSWGVALFDRRMEQSSAGTVWCSADWNKVHFTRFKLTNQSIIHLIPFLRLATTFKLHHTTPPPTPQPPPPPTIRLKKNWKDLHS